jgi:hypothetical protein
MAPQFHRKLRFGLLIGLGPDADWRVKLLIYQVMKGQSWTTPIYNIFSPFSTILGTFRQPLSEIT